MQQRPEMAERAHGTGQLVRKKGEDGEYVVIRVNAHTHRADLLLISNWPSRLEEGIAFSCLEVVLDRRSPSTHSMPRM